MTYDFLFDEDNLPKISEISYTFVDWMVHSCPGYWDFNLKWIEGNYWVEHLQLIDFLHLDSLKCPEF